MTTQVTSHVLDATQGKPADGIAIRLDRRTGDDWEPLATAITNDDGRVPDFGTERLTAGVYRLTFDVAGYFGRTGQTTFYPEIMIIFELADAAAHYHVPLLLSPYAYSTYRGS